MAQPLDISPALDINGVPAAIYLGDHGDEGGIREIWTDRGLEVTIEFIVDWKKRIQFIQALRGASAVEIGDDGTIESIVRQAPWMLPQQIFDFLPDMEYYGGGPYKWENYICQGTENFRPIKPKVDYDGSETGLAGWVYYEYVIIPARFGVAPYQYWDNRNNYDVGLDLSGLPYTNVKAKASGEVFQCDAATYKFKNLGVSAGNVGFIRPRQEFTITRYLMPYVDTERYDRLIGKVNQDPIVIGTTEYPPESMLYTGYEPEWVGDPSTGMLFCNIHHTILANGLVTVVNGDTSSSWNYAVTRNGTFDELVQANDNVTSPYTKREFKPVIWPETVSAI